MTATADTRLLTLRTLVAGVAGGAVFAVAGLPVPWLAGSMTAVAAVAVMGHRVHLPKQLLDLGMLVAGIAMGSTVTPEALATVARYPLSLLGLLIAVALIIATSAAVLERGFGWDRPTAVLSSVPGALTAVMATAVQSSGDVRRIAIVQSLRLYVLVGILPIALSSTVAMAPERAATAMSAGGMAMVFSLAFALAALFEKARVLMSLFLGGMAAAALLHAFAIVRGDLPEPIVMSGFLLIGVFCGIRFQGMTLRAIMALLRPGLVSLAATLAVAGVMAVVVHVLTGIRLADVLVAFAPGAVEAMILIGASLGLDALYVSTHHVARTLLLNTVTPLLVRAKAR